MSKRITTLRLVRSFLRSLERFSPTTPMLASEIGDAQRGAAKRVDLTRLMRSARRA